jgi:hypothetical protein
LSGNARVAHFLASDQGRRASPARCGTSTAGRTCQQSESGIIEHYLGNGRNVDITAKDLDVHPNTVRQRLDRFEEPTGRSLRETETVVEVWRALQRRRLS